MSRFKALAPAVAAAGVLLLAGCGNDLPPPPPPAPTVTTTTFTTTVSQGLCDIPHRDERKNCPMPYEPHSAHECEAHGCCWRRCEGCPIGIPYCFIPKTPTPSCVMHYEERKDCGNQASVTGEQSCHEAGCCWGEAHAANKSYPWCFYKKKPYSTCDVEVEKRKDCGSNILNDTACIAIGCCWGYAVQGYPWCYHKNPPVIDPSSTTTTTTVSMGACNLDELDRRECTITVPGSGEAACLASGCCWRECNGCSKAIPWCFRQKEPIKPSCLMKMEKRKDCGSNTTGKKACLEAGCCWGPVANASFPLCYEQATPVPTPAPTRAPKSSPEPTQTFTG